MPSAAAATSATGGQCPHCYTHSELLAPCPCAAVESSQGTESAFSRRDKLLVMVGYWQPKGRRAVLSMQVKAEYLSHGRHGGNAERSRQPLCLCIAKRRKGWRYRSKSRRRGG